MPPSSTAAPGSPMCWYSPAPQVASWPGLPACCGASEAPSGVGTTCRRREWQRPSARGPGRRQRARRGQARRHRPGHVRQDGRVEPSRAFHGIVRGRRGHVGRITRTPHVDRRDPVVARGCGREPGVRIGRRGRARVRHQYLPAAARVVRHLDPIARDLSPAVRRRGQPRQLDLRGAVRFCHQVARRARKGGVSRRLRDVGSGPEPRHVDPVHVKPVGGPGTSGLVLVRASSDHGPTPTELIAATW